jgi:probable F420-dependent oxidoreductase
MTAIKIGVTIIPQHTTADRFLRAWREADALGVDSIWTWDHFFPLSGDPNGPHFEAWTSLAAGGMQTQRAQIGCLVHSMGYRNPALLSAMAKTLDHFLGGRLILGLGAGWAERDYREYGYEFGTAGDRLRLLERGIEIIKERWAVDEPKPPRGTIPILIGGSGEKVTLRIAAQHADLWHGFGSPEEWGRKNRLLDDWCAKVGRDPRAIERSAHAPDPSQDESLADPGAFAERLEAYVAAGVELFIQRLPAPHDLARAEALLAWRAGRGS